jgi:hypothetical protein
MKIKYLEEAMSDKTQFDDNELGELLNYKDETIRNMFKVFVYTGLRRKVFPIYKSKKLSFTPLIT